MKQKHSTRNEFEYNGAKFRSFGEFCRKMNIPQATVYKIRQEHNCSTTEAVDIWFQKHGTRAYRCGTLMEMAALYGVPYTSIRGKMKNGGLEAFLGYYQSRGLLFPHAPVWFDGPWVPSSADDFPMSLLNISPDVFTDNDGNKLLCFRDMSGVSFEVQYQPPSVWLFRAGPIQFPDGLSPAAAGHDTWFGSWSQTEDGFFLQYAWAAKKTVWADVLRVISVMSRVVRDAASSKDCH